MDLQDWARSRPLLLPHVRARFASKRDLRRLGVRNARSTTFAELLDDCYRTWNHDSYLVAALTLGDVALVIEMYGYLGRSDPWAGALSWDTETLSVFRSLGGFQTLEIRRTG